MALGILATLAIVLVAASASKALSGQPAGAGSLGSVRPVGFRAGVALAELGAAVAVLAAPGRVSGALVAGFFAAFAAAHAWSWHRGKTDDCGCFGGSAGRGSAIRRLALTGGSAMAAAAAAVADPPSLVTQASRAPGTGLLIALGAGGAGWLWHRVFVGSRAPLWRSTPPPGQRRAAITDRLVVSSASFLERRMSRRTALLRLAAAGSALTVAPLRYLLYPGTALAAIGPGNCSGGLCTDGYTAFCCEINNGRNTCPSGTYAGGWWMCTDYTGRELCAQQGVRYYVDCNQIPGNPHWSCHCAHDSCNYRRVACNVFRYGQCNTQVSGVTAVVCRMVVCENPGSIPGLNCSSSVAVDDNVCGQDVPCLQAPARELAGAGGV
ncbi:MAG TPA: MauE/DoxX family redox-associated membrane protein [Solirubrobacteraceae bacterium]|nr:MauE/DoxX family redox-associated membrane protein [Solirubrobacteraceae bacterium]